MRLPPKKRPGRKENAKAVEGLARVVAKDMVQATSAAAVAEAAALLPRRRKSDAGRLIVCIIV
jgi:uncharacterized protein with PIN domain